MFKWNSVMNYPIQNIQNIVAANEGSAVSLGIDNLATSKTMACIYTQNSWSW